MENSQVHSIETKIDNTNMPSVLIASLSVTCNNVGYKAFGGSRVRVHKESDIQARFLVRNDSKK